MDQRVINWTLVVCAVIVAAIAIARESRAQVYNSDEYVMWTCSASNFRPHCSGRKSYTRMIDCWRDADRWNKQGNPSAAMCLPKVK